MKHAHSIIVLLLFMSPSVGAADTVNPRQAIEKSPGDIGAAVKHLGTMLQDRFRKDIFAEFDDGRIHRPNDTLHYAAKQILSLQRMGKLSVHDPLVKSAFTYEFLTARADPARVHEALTLYQRLPVANTDDSTWRLIRARCARLMNLPETLELYEQVAADMAGVAPSEEVRKVWEANRDEFNLPDYIKRAWRKDTTKFVYDAKGPDAPGSPPIKGSPLAFIDLAGVVGTDAAEWEGALGDLANASPQVLDGFYSQTKKISDLPWLDGRGFVNTEQALNTHLLAEQGVALKALREFQEAAFKQATAQATDSPSALERFRRYPWSASAQARLLKSAQQHVFQGQPQAAYRGFIDVLRHAEVNELRDQAQVGLWVSLAQFAEPDVVAKAFEGIDANAAWPWYGKQEKAAVVKAALVKDAAKQAPAPTLASLKQHIIQLPPVSPGAANQSVFNVDMQRKGNDLLLSSDGMLAMYNAASPGKPVWINTRRVNIPHGYSREPEAKQVLPLLGEKQVVSRWAGNDLSDDPVVAVSRTEGAIISDANPHAPQSRFRYRTVGSPVAADGSVYATQLQQPERSIFGHPEHRRWGEVSLSCFEEDGLSHRWTRVYPTAASNKTPKLEGFNSVLPAVNDGAVYFCTNGGNVIRADARDGEMEWIHFFRPETGDNYSQPANPRCLGSRPIVTDDKVICMPKFTGYLFALDKATGRRIWRTPILRGHQVLGVQGKSLVVVSANALYAVDLDTGKLRWGRSIVENHADGFQLPRSQMIDSSIYCGTKNALYRFDANRGTLLESRDWAMPGQVPMTFLVSGSDLYVISDLPMRDETFEKQLVDYHTVVFPAGKHREHARPVERKDGSTLIWRECMLMCVKDGKLLWSRFVSNNKTYGGRFTEKDGKISMTWSSGRSGTSAVHDSATGKLLTIQRSRSHKAIQINSQ